MRRCIRSFWVAAVVLSMGSAIAAPPITVYFIDRPPFMQKQTDGSLTGTVATPALRAFEMAQVPVILKEASPARQVKELKENTQRTCSIGWYKSVEREAYAKFTKALYQDAGLIGLANTNFHPVPGATVEPTLANPQTRVLTKDFMIYGPYLDAQFAKMKAQRVTTNAEFSQIVKMIQAGRAELSFLPQEEAIYYVKLAGFTESDFNMVKFPGMPAGEKRYIMCSRKVEDAIITQLNAALDTKP